MREITLDTCQGIGDIFWVIQKIYPYFDKIHLNILCIDRSELQTRAQKFIQLLPKIGRISYKVVSSDHYNRVAWGHYKLDDILQMAELVPNMVHEYAVNKPMEEGIRIDAIDPGKEVAWDLNFNVPLIKYPVNEYIVLYISGSKNNMTWDEKKWGYFISNIYATHKLHKYPLVLFGAQYDLPALNAVVPTLKANRIQLLHQVAGNPSDAIRCVRDAKLFIGYQSGMNVLADNYNVPQIMLYFPFLKPMLNTWCKPGHAERKIFNGFTFDQRPEDIMASCSKVLSSVASGQKLL